MTHGSQFSKGLDERGHFASYEPITVAYRVVAPWQTLTFVYLSVHSKHVATPTTNIAIEAATAKMFALAARNGVEDLHVAGAFSDRQAPSLNRRIRGRIYELLIATRRGHSIPGNSPFTKYVDDLAEHHNGGRGVAALQGAVARAVDDFAAAEALDAVTATKLRTAAIKGAVEAYKTVNRLNLGRSKNEERDRFAVEFWLRSIPLYWENPEVSPEFQTLLDDPEGRSP